MVQDDDRNSEAPETGHRVEATVDHGHSTPRFRLDELTEDDAWLSIRCSAVVSLQQWN
ncbi:hypothetical protein [Halostagnicola sp. A-GB9-2]|uniref:DUF7556 family protein n=1 Tax=Halostagnicola sp. A-GB9-2 TaxID=3048066 RepID=UPI0024BF4E8D|nr:hypothetical protein [Halostagnicola sp. A-GB9-2]MDJ1431936.1 hypothetical protein [Halostagnicola sp. A-GB9-2]